MKKAISLVLVLVLCLSLISCGKSEAVKNVETLIESIGGITLASQEAISLAEEAFSALSLEEREKVSNYDVLSNAKVEYSKLLNSTFDGTMRMSEQDLDYAEKVYAALSNEEKARADNAHLLQSSRERYQSVQNSIDAANNLMEVFDYPAVTDLLTQVQEEAFEEQFNYITALLEKATIRTVTVDNTIPSNDEYEKFSVSLTTENYSEYLSYTMYNYYNAFDEVEGCVPLFKSIPYDAGWVLINIDDFAIVCSFDVYNSSGALCERINNEELVENDLFCFPNFYYAGDCQNYRIENFCVEKIKGTFTYVSTNVVSEYVIDDSYRTATALGGIYSFGVRTKDCIF